MSRRKIFGISKDLNEGMTQTITAAKNNAGQLRYEVIALARIKLDPNNPRKLAIKREDVTDDANLVATDPLYERKKRELESIRSLAVSIKRQGVRNAIEVYKDGVDYRLISGERRVLASLMAGKQDIQARIVDMRPTEYDIRYLQWIENIEREDLSIWERIENVRQLVSAYDQNESKSITASQLKDIIGCSLPHAMTYLAILEAPSDIQALLHDNRITNLEKAAFLAKVTEQGLRGKLINACVDENLSLARLKKLASDMTSRQIQPKSSSKKGRVAKRVNLGTTLHISTVKNIMMAVIQQSNFKHCEEMMTTIDWNDYSAVSKGFQQFLKLMER